MDAFFSFSRYVLTKKSRILTEPSDDDEGDHTGLQSITLAGQKQPLKRTIVDVNENPTKQAFPLQRGL